MSKQDWQENLVLVSQEKRRGFGSSIQDLRSREVRMRVRLIWLVFAIAIPLLVSKIVYLQGFAWGKYQLNAYTNRVELKRENAERGRILDVNGEIVPREKFSAPIVGYLSEVREAEVGCFEGLCYSPGMLIGRAGVERIFEASLRGRDGGRLVEVDSVGKEVRELGSNQAKKGEDLVLAIDNRLQKILYEKLGERAGSAVVLNMQGKVLGLVSSPSYDPKNVTNYLKDKEKMYFLNRAISGVYPPGSVFKPVTAYAGLMEGKITKDTEYLDTGELKVGIYRYGNWYFDQYGKTEGSINLTRSLARSNDIYFYKVGEEVGIERLVHWAKKFGLGEKTGIELPGEVGGLVPDELWKERNTGEKWFLGNTYHLAIGQGDLLVTPLQVARMTLGVITGRMCKVSILRDSEVDCHDLGLKTSEIDLVREGMREVCAPGGTAFTFFDFVPPVICKTGTAQHGGQASKDGVKSSVKPHSWIVVAYPGDNPRLVLTVMLESAGEGSAEAGLVARQILDEWSVIEN